MGYAVALQIKLITWSYKALLTTAAVLRRYGNVYACMCVGVYARVCVYIYNLEKKRVEEAPSGSQKIFTRKIRKHAEGT